MGADYKKPLTPRCLVKRPLHMRDVLDMQADTTLVQSHHLKKGRTTDGDDTQHPITWRQI